MTTEEDKANTIKDNDSTNTNYNAADNDNDNDNDDEEHQRQHQNEQNEQNEQQLVLFESLLIKRIVKFLNYKPYDFAITLLPPPSSQSSSQSQSSPLVVSCDETINDDEEDDNNNSLLLSLTPEYRNLLETSIMLIREEEEEEEEDVVNENDNNDNTPKATATTTAAITTATAKYHLGLEAQHLPFIAKKIRKVYHTTKMKMKESKAKAMKKDNITNNNNRNRNEEEVEEETVTNVLLFNITSCLLLIQPDHSTVWSDRRRCLLSQIQRIMETTQLQNNNSEQEEEEKKENEILLLMWYNELDYLDLLMTQHSKAPSSWAHRKYVLRQLLSLHNEHHQQEKAQSLDGNMTSIQDLVMKEVNGICSSVAEKYPKNYYAWTHRIYVVSELLLSTVFIKNNTINNYIDIVIGTISNISKFLEIELKEKMYNEWLPTHPTDHSAIHYTCQILDSLFDSLNQKEEYYLLYIMKKFDDNDYREELHHYQQLKHLHAEVVKKKYELSILALKQVQILLSKYYQSSNPNSNSNCDCNCSESLWILRRMTCQIIWKHSSSSSSYIVIKHHEDENENKKESLRRRMMMRQLVRNDIKSVIDSLNINARLSSSSSDKEEEDSLFSLSLSQLVGAASNANGDDEKIDAISNTNNIHAWTFLAWCIVNIINIDGDNNNDNSNGNDNEKTKRPSFSLSSFSSTTTLFTHDIRETVMRRLQGAEARATSTATATATAANNDGSTADATATAATTTTTATSTTAQHNTRLWTSSSSPNLLLL
ncbi:hypothetical protein FRACYDRAFT_240792 [Fragilariopsis cylindrus CCMP1102]|uniref:Protein prenylyltransferase n=1 Tax=Fragilariopsis cylindrus CCMP1102 TaxID=635003 RepID=A0A1E7F7T8_9STRA|nr:hypothetical protein FRACYDRAFT_240792 [Fragilariopsis cylindrus CCMP1102]|eukprot:OEU14258.1 hypothetical protein FRACYDRAFT_240792 [Fragilariopsis cylindrus CCMP1102]